MTKRPRDPNRLAKLIVDIATGEQPDDSQPKRKLPTKRKRVKAAKSGRRA